MSPSSPSPDPRSDPLRSRREFTSTAELADHLTRRGFATRPSATHRPLPGDHERIVQPAEL